VFGVLAREKGDMGRVGDAFMAVAAAVAFAVASPAVVVANSVKLTKDSEGVWWFSSQHPTSSATGTDTTLRLTTTQPNGAKRNDDGLFVSLGVDHVMYSGDRFGPEGSP